MATYSASRGKVRAQICVNGIRESKTFETKSEAKGWAQRRELELAKEGGSTRVTFRELADRWLARYPTRNKIEWERQRLAYLLADDLGQTPCHEITAVTVADWRDERLKVNKPGTVLRDWNLLSKVCADAVGEMGLLVRNPFTLVKRPEEPPPRDRLPTQDEIERLYLMASTRPAGNTVLTMFRFSMQTGLSIGECCSLDWSQIRDRVIYLPAFKTRPARQVPLSKEAVKLLGSGEGKVWDMTAARADVNWRNLCKVAAVEDLHFHDARHYAATWLSKRMDSLALAKMLGHRDLKMLLNVYYQEDAASLVSKLD